MLQPSFQSFGSMRLTTAHAGPFGKKAMNAISISTPARPQLGARSSFAVASAVIGLALFASATPSPIYALYQERWHFSTPVLTLVYAVYCFGVLAALLLVGRISDDVGRRPVLAASLAGLAVLSSWSIGGLYLALGPSLVTELLHTRNHLAGGAAVLALTLPAAVSQLVWHRLEPRRAAAIGSAVLGAGMALTGASLSTGSAELFLG